MLEKFELYSVPWFFCVHIGPSGQCTWHC